MYFSSTCTACAKIGECCWSETSNVANSYGFLSISSEDEYTPEGVEVEEKMLAGYLSEDAEKVHVSPAYAVELRGHGVVVSDLGSSASRLRRRGFDPR